MTVDDMKLQRDGHLWAARYVRPEWPKVTREGSHSFVALYPGSGVIEYVPEDCTCAKCVRA